MALLETMIKEPHVEGNSWLKEVFFEKYDAKALLEMQVLMKENEKKMSVGATPQIPYAQITYRTNNTNHNNGRNRNEQRKNNNGQQRQSNGSYGNRDGRFPSMDERKEWERRLDTGVKPAKRQYLVLRDLCMGFHMPGFKCLHNPIMNGTMCQDRRRSNIIRKHTCICGAPITCDQCKVCFN